MNVVLQFFVLLICTFQLSTRSQAFECEENPLKAGTQYAKTLKEYWNSLVPRRARYIQSLEDMLKEMRTNPKCMSPYYRAFTAIDYAYLGTTVCGLATLRHNYEVPSKNISELSGEEICNFLKVNAAVALERVANNKIVFENCDGTTWFRNIFYKSWKSCNECLK